MLSLLNSPPASFPRSLTKESCIVIGRISKDFKPQLSDIEVIDKHRFVSRPHAEIRYREGSFWLTNLSQSNDIILPAAQQTIPPKNGPGDEPKVEPLIGTTSFCVGDNEFTFESGRVSEEQQDREKTMVKKLRPDPASDHEKTRVARINIPPDVRENH
jgi:predicted component of type VI protein secretion system